MRDRVGELEKEEERREERRGQMRWTAPHNKISNPNESPTSHTRPHHARHVHTTTRISHSARHFGLAIHFHLSTGFSVYNTSPFGTILSV